MTISMHSSLTCEKWRIALVENILANGPCFDLLTPITIEHRLVGNWDTSDQIDGINLN